MLKFIIMDKQIHYPKKFYHEEVVYTSFTIYLEYNNIFPNNKL